MTLLLVLIALWLATIPLCLWLAPNFFVGFFIVFGGAMALMTYSITSGQEKARVECAAKGGEVERIGKGQVCLSLDGRILR